ncbi:MAG: hypothetical protein QM802_18435 [Agriterribacter sp.]
MHSHKELKQFQQGKIVWNNASLSVDGVIIHGFEGGLIAGTGTFDPPDNSYNFLLNAKTGSIVPQRS